MIKLSLAISHAAGYILRTFASKFCVEEMTPTLLKTEFLKFTIINFVQKQLMKKLSFFKNQLPIFASLLIIAGCSNLETVEHKDDAGKVMERFSQDKKTGQKEGTYEAYHPDGKIKESANYVHDTLEGERKLFFENGQVDAIEHYQKGSFEGIFQKFYKNGQLANEGNYINNEMSGLWKRWYETGELWEEVNFEHNLENGPYKIYHKNGQINLQGSFIEGDNDHGELLKYNEDGQLAEKMFCHWGICATTWRLSEGDIQIDSARIKELGENNRIIIEREAQ